MPFNSFNFWLVFPFIFGLYWLIPAKYNQWRKVFLILVSYLLYMNWKPAFAIVLLGVTLITYWGGLMLENQNANGKKELAWLFALLAVLPLLVFKYYNFLNDSLSQGLVAIGLKFSLTGLNWAIPVGISFFIFQAVGYMLDVYHEKTKAEKNIHNHSGESSNTPLAPSTTTLSHFALALKNRMMSNTNLPQLRKNVPKPLPLNL